MNIKDGALITQTVTEQCPICPVHEVRYATQVEGQAAGGVRAAEHSSLTPSGDGAGPAEEGLVGCRIFVNWSYGELRSIHT